MINEKGKITFKQAWVDFWKGYVDFGGRSTRAGYWWIQLLIYLLIVCFASCFWSSSSYHC